MWLQLSICNVSMYFKISKSKHYYFGFVQNANGSEPHVVQFSRYSRTEFLHFAMTVILTRQATSPQNNK